MKIINIKVNMNMMLIILILTFKIKSVLNNDNLNGSENGELLIDEFNNISQEEFFNHVNITNNYYSSKYDLYNHIINDLSKLIII